MTTPATVRANPLTVDRFLYETLAGDPTLLAYLGAPVDPPRIYSDLAPLGTQPLWVIYSVQSSADVMGIGQARYMARLLVLVRVTDVAESYADAGAAYQRVDALLHGASGTVAGVGEVLSVIRQEPVRFTEQADGQQYRHVGGTYEFLIQ